MLNLPRSSSWERKKIIHLWELLIEGNKPQIRCPSACHLLCSCQVTETNSNVTLTTPISISDVDNILDNQFSRSVVSDSLQPHGLQHTRPPCPSPTPGACSNSCPLSRWYHPSISSFVVPFSSCLQSFPASGFFSNESALCIRWIMYWSFSLSPSNEYSGCFTGDKTATTWRC